MTIQSGSPALASDILNTLNASGYLKDGTVYQGDTANAKMTVGITINQGANDDEILALKSSDVGHGMTDHTETDTFGTLRKFSGAVGGLEIRGFSDPGEAIALQAIGYAGTGDSTKSANAEAPVVLVAYKANGTGAQGMGTNENLLVIQNTTASTQFIFDVEGSAHANVEWTTFDAHNDAALLTGLELALLDPVKGAFGEFMDANRARLQALKIVTFNEDGHHFVNFTRLAMLHTGAIRQTAARVERLEATLDRLARIPFLGRLLLG